MAHLDTVMTQLGHGCDTARTRFPRCQISTAACLDTVLLSTRYGSTRKAQTADTFRHDTLLSHFGHGSTRWGPLSCTTRYETTRSQPSWEIQDTTRHVFKPQGHGCTRCGAKTQSARSIPSDSTRNIPANGHLWPLMATDGH